MILDIGKVISKLTAINKSVTLLTSKQLANNFKLLAVHQVFMRKLEKQ